MSERPEQTAWGELIREAREAANLSIPKAAAAAGISEGTWGNIERGRQAEGRGRNRPAPGSDRTVAQMAAVVGVTPDRLAEAGRPEAASILRRIYAEPARLSRFTDPAERRLDADPDLTETEKLSLIAALRALRSAQSGVPRAGGTPA